MKSLVLLFLLIAPVFGKADPGEFDIRPTLPLTQSQLERLREVIRTDAEAATLFDALKKETAPMLDARPSPLAEIHYEGLVNTDPRRIASVSHLREMDHVAAVLRYWQASGDPAAAAMLERFIEGWASVYRPTGNDVNENKLLPLFTAYDALRPVFPPEKRDAVDRWIAWLATLHERQVKESDLLTNRYTKHIRLLAIFARVLEREDWKALALDGVRRFVTESLRADGTSLDLERRDSLTYHNSALRPLLEIGIWSGPEGRTIYRWECRKRLLCLWDQRSRSHGDSHYGHRASP